MCGCSCMFNFMLDACDGISYACTLAGAHINTVVNCRAIARTQTHGRARSTTTNERFEISNSISKFETLSRVWLSLCINCSLFLARTHARTHCHIVTLTHGSKRDRARTARIENMTAHENEMSEKKCHSYRSALAMSAACVFVCVRVI